MIPGIIIQMSSIGVETPIWIANGMGYWQGKTKITDDTNYY